MLIGAGVGVWAQAQEERAEGEERGDRATRTVEGDG